MSPPRFYCPQLARLSSPTAARYWLDPTEAKHATAVLRLRVEDELTLFDGQGRAALAKVIEAKRDTLVAEVTQWLEPQSQPVAELVLAIALPKGDRQKTLVDAATELGVTRLVPVLSERGVAQPTDKALERLRRQVIEACKQCGRNRLMEISEPVSLSDLQAGYGDGATMRWVAHPYAIAGPLRQLSSHLHGPASSSLLAIGPEGGFTDDEVRLLSDVGWSVVGLGPLILRIEIAAISAIAQVVGWYHENGT